MLKRSLADKAALAKVGAAVRQRLDADPAARRVPVDNADIYGIVGFLSAMECDRLMRLVDSVARPSTLYAGATDPQARTSYSGDFDRHDPFVQTIERRISDLLGINPAWGETFQGQRYRPGQQFKGHHDWFDTGADYWKREHKTGGQRSWTAMAYLNMVEEGGQTLFPKLTLSIPPQRGLLLVWNNATPEGLVNPATLHAGSPVIKGAKYVITKWFRTRKWA